jgi:hypothetical protein
MEFFTLEESTLEEKRVNLEEESLSYEERLEVGFRILEEGHIDAPTEYPF